MTALVAFIVSYLMAAIFLILGGVPFAPLVVLWINFFVQVPIAISLGFDKPAEGLMDHKPRPLTQPILSRGQWVRATFIGLLMAIATVAIEAHYESESAVIAATVGFVVFGLFNVALGFTAHSETRTTFNRDIISSRQQLGLVALALLLIILPTQLAFLQRILGLIELGAYQWLVAIGVAVALVLVDETIKVFLRRSLERGEVEGSATERESRQVETV